MAGRLAVVPIVLASLTFAACTTSPGAPNPGAAIRAALVDSGFADSVQTFPDQPGQMLCTIGGGGPAPGIRVSGTCQTSLFWNGRVFLVTLTEYWDASAFHGGDIDPTHGQLSYSWLYQVDGAGDVTFLDSFGNFPPQEMM
jgi:hypothetical protein